eukprot:SAG25_NODE_180_length_12624_cov_23.832495_3_plen_120_part_00
MEFPGDTHPKRQLVIILCLVTLVGGRGTTPGPAALGQPTCSSLPARSAGQTRGDGGAQPNASTKYSDAVMNLQFCAFGEVHADASRQHGQAQASTASGVRGTRPTQTRSTRGQGPRLRP